MISHVLYEMELNWEGGNHIHTPFLLCASCVSVNSAGWYCVITAGKFFFENNNGSKYGRKMYIEWMKTRKRAITFYLETNKLFFPVYIFFFCFSLLLNNETLSVVRYVNRFKWAIYCESPYPCIHLWIFVKIIFRFKGDYRSFRNNEYFKLTSILK